MSKEPTQSPGYAEAYAAFCAAYPSYAQTSLLDELRRTDYERLDRLGHIYLDYTGGSLYAQSQLDAHFALLRDHVFGNPHSSNPTSLAMTELVEQARRYVLTYFNADPQEYMVIFTLNASGALKLVGESYPLGPERRYLLTFDNHNSVNGIREFARARGARVTYIPICIPDLRLNEAMLEQELAAGTPGLFAYPAQSNFSGVQHPLHWVERAQALGWDVLLDAAAFTPTNRLDLQQVHPDFVSLSFYKIFGYPTGIGALLARRSAAAKLRRPWFAGGTITMVSVQGDKYYLADNEAAFEDGTVNYLGIPAVEIGLRHIAAIGIETIHTRVVCLTGWLLEQLHALRHRNGAPLVRIYGPLTLDARGGTITMNFYDAEGRFFDHRRVEAEANQARISLRTGCFCNPGGGEVALGISAEELTSCFAQKPQRFTLDDFRVCIDRKSTGAVRVSLGVASNFADAWALLQFARGFLDRPAI